MLLQCQKAANKSQKYLRRTRARGGELVCDSPTPCQAWSMRHLIQSS